MGRVSLTRQPASLELGRRQVGRICLAALGALAPSAGMFPSPASFLSFLCQRCPDVPSLGQAPLCLRVLSSSRIGRYTVHSGGQGRMRGARQSPPSSCPCRWRVLGGGGGQPETPGLAPACLLPLQVGDVAPFCPGAATEGLPPPTHHGQEGGVGLKEKRLLDTLV